MMTTFADVRSHPWGYSWCRLIADREGDRFKVIHDTVVITRCDSGLYCWRCRKYSAEHPCEHVCDALALRNRTQGEHGDDAADSPEAA